MVVSTATMVGADARIVRFRGPQYVLLFLICITPVTRDVEMISIHNRGTVATDRPPYMPAFEAWPE